MNKKVVFIVAGILINVVIVAAIYVNYQLDQIAASLNQPGIIFTDIEAVEVDNPAADTVNRDAAGPDTGGSSPVRPVDTAGEHSRINTQNNPVVRDVQARIDQPIEKKDLAKAGLIILRNLEPEEIRYIYNVGKKDHPSREELVQVRSILVNNLSAEDIAVLRQLGSKYGKSLKILDTSIPIK